MGQCSSSSSDDQVRTRKNIKINRQLSLERRAKRRAASCEVRLLLLGTAETGKSTLLKQLKVVHGIPFTDTEICHFRNQIRVNLFQCARDLIRAMHQLRIPMDSSAYAAQFIELMEAPQFHDEAFAVSELTVEAVKSLWMDTGVQYCMSRGNEFHMMDCCTHFMNSIDQILNVNYVPTNQDIFFMREATNCIQQICFTWKDTVFHVFDVGGHRKQRKSWAPYFESVKAIIYVVAISAFDQILPGDEDNANRLVDSLNLFGTVCNHPLFKKTSLILFMNKIDVFKAKLRRSEISSYFPEFQGRNTYHDGCEFFVNLFLDMTKYKENKVYTHFTWATDTRQISKIIHSVNMIIAGSVMRDAEFF
ncbi:G protein alpha subunit [Chytriomyces cf. hyalinus JEL632]|nr:G protein alpha subunit [Chytriomyces cf. hyalinus JEL632]